MRSFLLALLLAINTVVLADELVGFAAFENGDYTTAIHI